MLDIAREKDIERLRQVALVQKSQLEHLISMLARKCAQLEKLKGSEGELQMSLKLLEAAQKEASEIDRATGRGGNRSNKKGTKERDPQRGHGATEQPALERVPLLCVLDDADRACPDCGDPLSPLKGQAEESEMIDVVEPQERGIRAIQGLAPEETERGLLAFDAQRQWPL